MFIFRIKPFIPTANDPLLELDRNGRKFSHCLDRGEPVLNVTDLKQFLPCTCNLDPYLNKLIRGIYIYLKNINFTRIFSLCLNRFSCLFLHE
jgi:hypothetical protein